MIIGTARVLLMFRMSLKYCIHLTQSDQKQEAENFFFVMTEQPTEMAQPTAVHIAEEWYIGITLQ